MEPKYPKGLLWKMNLEELKAIADLENIPYPEDVRKLGLYRIVLNQMPMAGSDPLVSVEKPDDSPASARIKRIRQAS